MIVSHKKRFIWFQPAKVASTTIYERIKKYNECNYPQENYFNLILNKNSCKHLTLSDFSELPESNLKYKKVSFVRNPYDRFYSSFEQAKHDFLEKYDDFSSRPWGKVLKEGFLSFAEFALNMHKENKDFFPNIKNHEYVFNNNEKVIDYVGYVEFFEIDFTRISKYLDLEIEIYKSMNVRSTPINCNPKDMKHSDYKYIDRYCTRSLSIINEIFQRDFSLFHYRPLNKISDSV